MNIFLNIAKIILNFQTKLLLCLFLSPRKFKFLDLTDLNVPDQIFASSRQHALRHRCAHMVLTYNSNSIFSI